MLMRKTVFLTRREWQKREKEGRKGGKEGTSGDLVQSIGVIIAGYIIWFKVSVRLCLNVSMYMCYVGIIYVHFHSARVVLCRSNLYLPFLNSGHHLHTHCAQRCTSCSHGRSCSLSLPSCSFHVVSNCIF